MARAGTVTASAWVADPLIRNAHGAVAVWSPMTVKTSDCTVVRPGATFAGRQGLTLPELDGLPHLPPPA